MPQFRLSWYVFGPGVQSGLPALSSFGTFSAPMITTAPARLTNVRREIFEGVLDDGLTADVATTMPGAQGTQVFPRPNASFETSSPSEAVRTAEVEALRPRLARISTVVKVETVLTMPSSIPESQRRDLYRRIAAALNRYLEANGGFVLQGLSVRSVPAAASNNWLIGFGLIGLGLVYLAVKKD